MSIENLIKINGPLTIAEFMQEAMYNPQKGYYRTKKAIGKNQDFITAPEISSIFGELIAAYFLNFIIQSNKKIAFTEMGAGLGTLFFDITASFSRMAKKLGKFEETKEKVSFNIIEISEELTKIQQEKLKNSEFEINWHQNFEDFQEKNQNKQIYFIANELFDCFEIHQFAKTNNKWQEVMVALKKGIFKSELSLILENFSQEKHNFIEKLANENEINHKKDEIIFEHSFKAQNFMEKLTNSIKNQGGIALIIDYGYYNSPLKNSLQSIKSHEKQDIFQNIYNSDLTALVNFKMLEKTAKNNNLQTSLVSQQNFLTSLGIKEKEQFLLQNDKNIDKNQLKNAVNRLIDSDQMGELFKCLIIWDNVL